jgi:hypothetical protein
VVGAIAAYLALLIFVLLFLWCTTCKGDDDGAEDDEDGVKSAGCFGCERRKKSNSNAKETEMLTTAGTRQVEESSAPSRWAYEAVAETDVA